MAVVVTGGCGFIGSHLVERLAHQGEDVIVYDPAAPPPDLDCGGTAVRHVRADIRDERALAGAIGPDVHTVYHLCALVGVDQYLDDPLEVIDVAVSGTRNVLRAASAAGVKVVVSSTSEIYGKNPDVPWSEDADRVLGSVTADRWSYSASKAVAEHMVVAYARHRGLRASVVRYFNVYGPRQRPAYVISKTVHRVLRGLPPLLYDDGTQTRCFTFVEDAVDATLRVGAGETADGQCFNVGSDRETSVGDAVRLVTRLAGAEFAPIRVSTDSALGSAYEDIPRRVPDVGKARELLGWRSRTPLQAGLARTIAWAKRSPWWLDAVAGASERSLVPTGVTTAADGRKVRGHDIG
ncbi:NAD-dependent epimerase/dehydratase family protein [Actinomadura citrea]|uniref:UDP-glucose 4-epimerase n=1 Tax=Actinomadura citrea TaxID=46158 RepID=A0A7Y9KC70_9ACTN|nr:NAD-dependent epimerase/dehydratase family protein [Actinomadura citrea]NYE13702.1 UDP-glucose 4-epimerase [Actinomadura citrea]GGU03689.1 UDP-glucose 4-epimerase [Actinomadura citrea]